MAVPTSSREPGRRRAYRAPRLVVYGSIRDLTRENGSNTNKDGGNNARNNRT